MDYKYIEQLLERYFNAETSLEEERILRTFFSQEDIPAEMMHWKSLFTFETEDALDEDFDARILQMIDAGEERQEVRIKAREVKLTRWLLPLFKAAAVVAILLTLGNAAQAPWDNSWKGPEEYAKTLQADTVVAVSPIQAENISEVAIDSSQVMVPDKPHDEGF